MNRTTGQNESSKSPTRNPNPNLEAQETTIQTGTAGWSYPHWNGLVYPARHPKLEGSNPVRPDFHPLELISRHMDLVEINSTFYQPLKPEVAKLWAKKVSANPRFRFTAKLHQQFTHRRILDAGQVDEFERGLIALQQTGRLGAVLMQFPWTFRFTEENRDFLIRLRRAFHRFPLVAEMRHDSWLAEEALGTFLDYKIGFCNIDQPEYMRAMPATALLTSGIGYVRLHGRNPANTLGAFRADASRKRQHDYLYNREELAEWSRRIRQIDRFADRTFVVFNNDAAGKSFVNALQMGRQLGGENHTAPVSLLHRYPEELEHFSPAERLRRSRQPGDPARNGQQWLFRAA